MKQGTGSSASAQITGRLAQPREHTVLVVDDEPAITRLLTRIRRDEGYTALSAGTFTDAVAALLDHPVDLVLIDYLLKKDGNGLDLARQLVRIRPEIPFVFVSGRLNTEITVAAVKLGAYDVMDKPIRRDRLCPAVRAALALGQRRGPEWRDLDPAASNADRLATLILRTASAVSDPTTLDALGHHIGVSAGTFCELCRLLRVKAAHDARDLARLVRAVIRSGGSVARIPSLLGVHDHRTLDALLTRAGLASLAPTTIAPAEFLRRQQFIPFEHEVVQALLVLLANA